VFTLLLAPLTVVPLLLTGPAHAAPGDPPLTVGAVQGATTDAENPRTDRTPLATGTLYDVRGVVTQRTLARTAAGAEQHGFFLQSRRGTEDGDPTSSDGVFVFMGAFTSLIGGYVPTVGDEVVIRARVSEYFSMTQLSGASLVTKLAGGLDVNTDVVVDDATPPAVLAAADRFHERHEGARLRVRAGAGAVSGRNVFDGTADAEIFVIDRDDPLLRRADPTARRTFRDAHPLDNDPARFDDGNGGRILLGSMGVKSSTGDSTAMLPPARTFDTLTGDAVGGLYYAFNKYGVQPESASFAAGADPSRNAAPRPARRDREFAVSTYNVENLYDFRDDPFDGCDFTGNTGCPGVSPPFDYVPASQADYTAQLGALADQIVTDLHSPDLILVQEAEDQDICAVIGTALRCGTTDDADGAPDTLQELALTVRASGGPAYAAAYDRTGADARGITSAFLYRTDRLRLAAASAGDPVLGSVPAVAYRSTGLPANADVTNPKALNAVLPANVDRSTGVDGGNVFTRAPQVAKFEVTAAPGARDRLTLWAVSNHYSSGPDSRVGQRREQAAYGAAIVTAIGTDERVVYGGDLNVFPRPDDPVAANPGDQLGPLYRAGLHNLYDDLLADAPSSAYSYVFDGQAQTLDHLFVTDALYDDLIEMRAAHVNADWAGAGPAGADGNGSKGSSDHDPQVARFHSRAAMSVGDTRAVEGAKLVFPVTLSRPLSVPVTVCATPVGRTAWPIVDFDPRPGCRTIPAGRVTGSLSVAVRADGRRERDETLTLLVVPPPGIRTIDGTATGTITDD
jgi:hypothetical protein